MSAHMTDLSPLVYDNTPQTPIDEGSETSEIIVSPSKFSNPTKKKLLNFFD